MRVFYYQIVFATLFKFFENWHFVRIFGTAILSGILIASFYFFCHTFQCRKYFIWTAILLIFPFSWLWFYFILTFPHYIPPIAILFVSLSLSELCAKTTNPKHLKRFLCLAVFIALLSGLNGPRQLVVSYIPLFLTAGVLFFLNRRENNPEIILANRNFMRCALFSFIGAALGFAINRQLHHYFSFMRWHKRHFQLLDFARFKEIINGFLDSFGFVKSDFSIKMLLSNILAILLISIFIFGIIFLIKNYKAKKGAAGRLGWFCLMASALFFMLYFLTDMPFTPRYCLPLIVLFIPLLAFISVDIKNPFILPLFVILFIFNSFLFCWNTAEGAKSELPKLAKILTEKGYKYGYSTFWKANVTTELSNGNIDMYAWVGDERNLKTLFDIDDLFEWLQKKDHFKKTPKGKVFVLFSIEQSQNNNWPKLATLGKEEYRSPNLVVYGFDSYERLLAATRVDLRQWKATDLLHARNHVVEGELLWSTANQHSLLTFGPHARIKKGRYELKITYTSPLPENEEAGSYDVSINSNIFYQGKLMGSHGKMQTFKTSIVFENDLTRVEFRTFSSAAKTIGIQNIQLLSLKNAKNPR